MGTAFAWLMRMGEILVARNKTVYPPRCVYAKPQSRSCTPLFLQCPPQLEATDSRAFPSRESPAEDSSWVSLLSPQHQIAGCTQGTVGVWKGCLRKPVNWECSMDCNGLGYN